MSPCLVQATERLEAIYPTLKELALAGSPGTKTTKQASQQLLPVVVKAMQESKFGVIIACCLSSTLFCMFSR